MNKAILSLVKVYISTLIISLFARLIFLIVNASQTSTLDLSTILGSLINGITLDISTAGYIIALPLVALLIGAWGGWRVSVKIWRTTLRIYLFIISLVTALIVAIDANLYGYWGYRIDATLLPYLANPAEATASVTVVDTLIALSIFAIILSLSTYLYFKSVSQFEITPLKTLRSRLSRFSLLLLLIGVVFVGIRGGVSESVANVSKVYFSNVQYANHAAVNPLFSLLSSVSRVEDYDAMYPFYPTDQLESRFEALRGMRGKPSQSILTTSRPNIAIIICESYTRAIMDLTIDGDAVMPNLRDIAHKGILFENSYATGGRTDKGVASVLSGFPSQPQLSIMKIPAKSRNLPSIAQSLKSVGYSSQFYYGGDLNFMDMASYLYATGWERLTWSRDIAPTVEQQRRWGYSDGVMCDLFADEVIRLNNESKAPFLASLLTLSSHEPFDVPNHDIFEDKMINSMSYTDKQLGAMITKLRSSSAWDNLLVVIVADHTYAYPYNLGYNSPIRHHIPMILSGGALSVSGIVEEELISQIDIIPTILAQMEIDTTPYIFSRDYYDPSPTPRFAYYTFSDGFGVIEGGEATIYDNKSQISGIATPRAADVNFNQKGNPQHLDWGKTILQKTHETIGDL